MLLGAILPVETDGFEAPEFDDAAWDRLDVPSHWQLHGYGKPAYLNISHPIPLDPPYMPDENPTGDYRRVFELPQPWADTPAVLRFDVDASAPVRLSVPQLGIDAAPADEAFAFAAVRAWTAEDPFLYDAELATDGERVRLRVGFRAVAIDGQGVLTVNGRRIVLRGVNRHEFDPDRGWALTRETMRRDVELMKRRNVNAVRTSHYPPHPEFLDLCDELGLWVVLECDLETHGFEHPGPEPWAGNPSDDPRWRDAYLDRMRRTVERDKNHPNWPQENGNRADVRWAELTGPTGTGLRIEADTLVNLAARRYRDQHLAEARHQHDLTDEPVIHLHTDHAVQGLGSAAVGPGVFPQHRLTVRAAEFCLTLAPVLDAAVPGRNE